MERATTSLRVAAVAVAALLLAAGCSGSPAPLAAPNPSPSPTPMAPVVTPIPAPSPTPVVLGDPVHKIRGWLHTVGTQIVTGKNNPVRLVSIMVNGLQHGSGTPDTVPQAYSGCLGWKTPSDSAFGLIASWGFNSVRLQVTWANLEPTAPGKRADGTLVHHWNGAYLSAIDGLVKGFAAKGVAVILEMNQVRWSPVFHHIPLPNGGSFCGQGMPTWLYSQGLSEDSIPPVETAFFADKGHVQDRFADAWRMLAKRYARNPMVVGADILNEPYDLLVSDYPGAGDLRPKDIDLTGFYEKIGGVIHAANRHLLLIFEENRDKATKLWSVVHKPELPNAVLSVHWYPAKWKDPLGKPRLRLYVDRAHGWDLPIWIGEFNAFRYTSTSTYLSSWASDLTSFVAYARDNDLGWTITSYGSGQIQLKGSETPKPGIVPIIHSGR
jgi:hypothetical protein